MPEPDRNSPEIRLTPAVEIPWWRKVLEVGLFAFCVVYLANPTFGIFELIPDALPLVGNIDEGAAGALLLALLAAWRQRRNG